MTIADILREPLQRLVEDDNVDEYVRSPALGAFIVLVNSGQMAREEVVAYYRTLSSWTTRNQGRSRPTP